MTYADFEYRTRPGGLALSITAFAGLSLLAAFLWQSLPGFVMLLAVPALAVCFYQIVVTPTYGLHLSRDAWHVFGGDDDVSVPTKSIAHLRVTDDEAAPDYAIVLRDGKEIPVPGLAVPSPEVFIREATARGVAVRQR